MKRRRSISDPEFDIPGVVTVAWDAATSSVLVVWSGRGTAIELAALLDAEVRALREHQTSKLLADCTRQAGIPGNAQDGADALWLPEIIAAGLKRFAVVIPEDRDAAVDLMDRLGDEQRLAVGFFTTVDEARTWLST